MHLSILFKPPELKISSAKTWHKKLGNIFTWRAGRCIRWPLGNCPGMQKVSISSGALSTLWFDKLWLSQAAIRPIYALGWRRNFATIFQTFANIFEIREILSLGEISEKFRKIIPKIHKNSHRKILHHPYYAVTPFFPLVCTILWNSRDKDCTDGA
jgi:hypothetical protein